MGEPLRTPGAVSTKECAAMRLLARDGWTIGELRLTMLLETSESVRYHVLGRCAHNHDVPPIREWDGHNPPSKLSANKRIA